MNLTNSHSVGPKVVLSKGPYTYTSYTRMYLEGHGDLVRRLIMGITWVIFGI